ncbi:MAG: hypothetical protein ACI83H_002541 [Glaciecola sp.]|jgi:hypothetical protein
MTNKSIRIALSSVLIYLIFKKSLEILTALALWLSVKFRIENDFILIGMIVLIGLLCLSLLIILFNKFLGKEKRKSKTVYLLLTITIALTLLLFLVKYLFSNYMNTESIMDFQQYYNYQNWTIILDIYFPLIGLFYFLWRLLKKDKKYSG